MKKITSITILNRAEGLTNSYTYSEIDDNTGEITLRNKRKSYVITSDEELEAVKVLQAKVQARLDN